MTCKRCLERGKTWKGSDPKCAFESGVFSSNNWSCATALAIRELFDEKDDHRIMHCREENQNVALLSTTEFEILPLKDEKGWRIPQPTSLWVGWYKSRGCTEGMWLMFETDPPRQPTEEECLKILAHYKSA